MKKYLLLFAMLLTTIVVSAQTLYEATINDPDGYTNVRKSQSSSSAIVARFYDGERFYVKSSSGSWWPVYYSINGSCIGYMHKSRIRTIRTVSNSEFNNNGSRNKSTSTRYRAVINDPDGYTNIRKSASSNSAIVGRITESQTFYYTPTSGSWYKVYYTQDGAFVGYMHKSRISRY